ncbi:MAG: hypothetical protein GX847_05425 [Clostridiales bacterium]|nr:hypothetical protein [Clostridiales bacterium]
MSTGTKTLDSAFGVGQDGQPLTHMSQDFEELGKATGVVTSVPFNHATPAGFVAHSAKRSAYAAIAEEMIKSSATDVIMGGGHPLYNDDNVTHESLGNEPNYGHFPKDLWEEITDGKIMGADANGDGTPDAWSFIEKKADFEALMTGDAPDRVLGIAQVFQTLQGLRVMEDWTKPAYTTPKNQNVPTLETMVKGALNVLDNNAKGFFLMVEGGAPDWSGHYNQPGRLIEEMEDFYNTVSAVITWIEANGGWEKNLLMVTGDHETGLLSGAEGILSPVVNNGKGNMPTMFYHVGTTYGIPWHSNQLIPFFAKGAGSELFNAVADMHDPYRGWYMDNTDISRVIREICGITNTEWATVQKAKELSLIPDGLQNYNSGITRENFCNLAFELLNKVKGTQVIAPVYPDSLDPFTDYTDFASYKVFTLYKLGIVNGTGEGKFSPDKVITREEAAKLLNSIAVYLGISIPAPSTTFNDAASISSWAVEGVNNMAALGVMNGTGGGKFSPKGTYTGYQAILTMMRLYNLVK